MDTFQSIIDAKSPWIGLAAVVGLFSVSRLAYQIFSVALQTFVLPGASLRRFGAQKGAWAVVTGASDGIGKEFASQLAQAGFNVFLAARNKELLQNVALDIKKKCPGIQTETFAIDFTSTDREIFDSLGAVLSRLDIGVLVNNVGKSHNMPAYLADTPLDEINDIITINVSAMLKVTYAVLPGMIERKRGLILNIGSFAGAIPSPMLATYSGSKAFLATFSSALGEEVKQHGIVVENANTYFVVSKLSKIRKPSLFVPQPGDYVRAVLSKIGLSCDFALTILRLRDTAVWYTHNLHKDIRKRALRKLEREAKSQ